MVNNWRVWANNDLVVIIQPPATERVGERGRLIAREDGKIFVTNHQLCPCFISYASYCQASCGYSPGFQQP